MKRQVRQQDGSRGVLEGVALCVCYEGASSEATTTPLVIKSSE